MTSHAPDTKVRDLQRRFLQSGTPDDEAAWLLERVRVGDLAPERLVLAAYLGHAPARQALGAEAPVAPEEIVAWVAGLDAIGPEIAARASQVREVERDRTYLREWVLGFDVDRKMITKRARAAYSEHLLPWALAAHSPVPT